MFTLDDAVGLAATAHAGQVDKSGAAYIEHPLGVARIVVLLPSFHELSEEDKKTAMLAAVLHDVLEDTDETEESLLAAGVPAPVVETVKLLTKSSVEDLGSYYTRVVSNSVSRCVKTADLLHNNLPERRDKLPEGVRRKLGLKYGLAIPRILLSADEDFFYRMVNPPQG